MVLCKNWKIALKKQKKQIVLNMITFVIISFLSFMMSYVLCLVFQSCVSRVEKCQSSEIFRYQGLP